MRTTEEIQENNKLIADFLNIGYTVNSFKPPNLPQIKELNFHNSWDSLMLAVEKIGIPPLKSFTIDAKDSESGEIEHGCIIDLENKYIEQYSLISLINAVYMAVIEFINWYNKNK